MSWALLSPICIVTGAALLIVLERVRPYDLRQKLFRVGLFTDFFWYTLVQNYLLGLAISAIISALDQWTHASRWHLVSSWPVVAQLAFFWVTHDMYIYWFHRLQHRNALLWRIHEAHHSGKDVDWISGARSHALEILINQTIEFAPIVLLGAHPDVALMKGALDGVWGMYIHSNIDVRAGAFQYVLNGPQMHRWHHSSEGLRREVNFATKIAAWDWIFGTAYLPESKPRAYGLWNNAPFPEGPGWRGALLDYFAQHAWAFRAWEGSGARQRRLLVRSVLAVAGLALVAYLVVDAGPGRVASVLWGARAWLPALVLLEACVIAGDLVGFRTILGGAWRRMPPSTWVRSSAVAYAMMVLLPGGRAAGELARAALLSRHVGIGRATAASTQVQAASIAANAVLSACACAAVATLFGARSSLALLLAANAVLMSVLAAALLVVLRDRRGGRWLLRLSRRLLRAPADAPLDPAERGRLPWGAIGAACTARAAQVLQYGVIVYAVGGAARTSTAFVAYGIHLVSAAAGDALPGAVGGAYRVFAADLGFASDPARALSIALIVYAVQLVVVAACVVVAALARAMPLSDATPPLADSAPVPRL
jgi:sterol desaturase/sphingolipid hydroxylase (fatty acid hydroxylase superfamily)